jgi:hypothetical protein
MEANGESFCPSFRCGEGSKLLGVRQNGKIAILPNPLELDEAFLDSVKSGNAPEERFRFVNKCALGGCRQWTGKACGIALRVVHFLGNQQQGELPACSIRSSCRWFGQEGDKICALCPYIITDITADEILDYFNPDSRHNK